MNPQEIFRNKVFYKVLLDPPILTQGSWRGAGKLLIDDKDYWLTSRPRNVEKRGYGIEFFHSNNGNDFSLYRFISKEEISSEIGIEVDSIENTQLIIDPLTGKYYLYASVNIDSRLQKWVTVLLTSDDIKGEWKSKGIVINNDQEYDSAEARDCSIEVLDGMYIGLCKARKLNDNKVYTELLVSKNGISWKKLGLPTINGVKQDPSPAFLLNGNIYSSVYGPMFIGTVTTFYKNAHVTKYFGSYIIDLKSNNLEEVFITEWKSDSKYERQDFPIHNYCNVIYDENNSRWDIVIEAIDPIYSKNVGTDNEMDRVLLYISKRK
ncbi:glycoside hydrolase family 43 protein [Acidianus manzaensis]|uniref:Glycosyl hydrolase family 32 N-terminal domain-containing protein n=1 Tax=Acidianus manzaensis TaxID=282676 RepID=A0A1W6JZ07_9CREN|nr:glycoside hydrolase family 43 protein [Acidianus manzaensis]ARM75465.1 hypothetical protein B6F84_05090 [Acidianus manzaensis]